MLCRVLGGSKLQPYKGSSIRRVILWSYFCYLLLEVAHPGCLPRCCYYFATVNLVETPGLVFFFFKEMQILKFVYS